MDGENRSCVVTAAINTISNHLIALFEDSSTNEDSEEEELELVEGLLKQNRTAKSKVTRILSFADLTVVSYTARQFQEHFRLSVTAYNSLLAKIGPTLKRQGPCGRSTINIEKQVLSTLWLLATPDSYRSVGDRFDMGKSSLSVSFFRVIHALNDISSDLIRWPFDKLQYIRESFQAVAGLDNVIGAVDGTFVPIKAPRKDAEVYITRKCEYAVILQAVCDCDLNFIDVFVGYPGSVSDTRVFRNSDLYKKVEQNVANYFPNNEFIIGDKAYPILAWCIPPFIEHGALSRAQKNFNEVHAKTRQTIERSFALLFGRFRRLKFLDMNRTDAIPAVVLAACVLHNLCLNQDDLFREEYIEEGRHDVCNNNDEWGADIAPTVQQAKIRRNVICNSLWNQ